MKVSFPIPGSHKGEIPHLYTLYRGTPTSTISARTTQALEVQSSIIYPLRPEHIDILMLVAPADSYNMVLETGNFVVFRLLSLDYSTRG
jgi:hypothetical protein